MPSETKSETLLRDIHMYIYIYIGFFLASERKENSRVVIGWRETNRGEWNYSWIRNEPNRRKLLTFYRTETGGGLFFARRGSHFWNASFERRVSLSRNSVVHYSFRNEWKRRAGSETGVAILLSLGLGATQAGWIILVIDDVSVGKKEWK